MRFYTRQHRYYCGIDRHTRTMYVCILDAARQVLVHQNLPAKPEAFLEVIASYRDDLVVPASASSPGTDWRTCWAAPRARHGTARRQLFSNAPPVDCQKDDLEIRDRRLHQ
jgi:hypothetical protein